MRFTNRAGASMVVVRSMELTQKKSTMSFKALDGILRTFDPQTGERISMSHKCTELDRQIPLLLGVSKPILEHVVFCHTLNAVINDTFLQIITRTTSPYQSSHL